MFTSPVIWSSGLLSVIVLGFGSWNWMVSGPDPGVVQPFEAKSVLAAWIASRSVHWPPGVSVAVLTVMISARAATAGKSSSAAASADAKRNFEQRCLVVRLRTIALDPTAPVTAWPDLSARMAIALADPRSVVTRNGLGPRYSTKGPLMRPFLVSGVAALRGQRGGRGLRRDLRVLDLAEALDQALPLLGLEDLAQLLDRAARGGEGVADVDVVVVVGQDEGGGPEIHQGDDLRRAHRALQQKQVLDHGLGDRTRALVALDRDPVDGGDVDRGAVGVRRDVARGGQVGVTAFERGDREAIALGDQVLHHRQDAAIDLAVLDVLATAGVDREGRVVQDPLLERRLRHQEDLADGGVVCEGVLVGGAVDRRGLEQLPAVEDRLRVDRGRALAG